MRDADRLEGRFGDERSALSSLGSASSSIARTTVFDTTTAGRRAADHESSGSLFGRRAADRMFFDRSSIRVDVDKVDRLLNLAGELVIAQSILAEAARHSGAANEAALRDSVAHVARQTRESIATTLVLLHDTLADLIRFQSLLVMYLQQITPYVDTRDRSVAGLLRALSGAIDAVADELLKKSEAMLARDRRHEMRVSDLDERLAALQQQIASLQQLLEKR